MGKAKLRYLTDTEATSLKRAIITVKDADRETLIAKYEMMSNVFTVLEINLI